MGASGTVHAAASWSISFQSAEDLSGADDGEHQELECEHRAAVRARGAPAADRGANSGVGRRMLVLAAGGVVRPRPGNGVVGGVVGAEACAMARGIAAEMRRRRRRPTALRCAQSVSASERRHTASAPYLGRHSIHVRNVDFVCRLPQFGDPQGHQRVEQCLFVRRRRSAGQSDGVYRYVVGFRRSYTTHGLTTSPAGGQLSRRTRYDETLKVVEDRADPWVVLFQLVHARLGSSTDAFMDSSIVDRAPCVVTRCSGGSSDRDQETPRTHAIRRVGQVPRHPSVGESAFRIAHALARHVLERSAVPIRVRAGPIRYQWRNGSCPVSFRDFRSDPLEQKAVQFVMFPMQVDMRAGLVVVATLATLECLPHRHQGCVIPRRRPNAHRRPASGVPLINPSTRATNEPKARSANSPDSRSGFWLGSISVKVASNAIGHGQWGASSSS